MLANNAAPQDYGPLVILRHETDDGPRFFTLYGHLSDDTLAGLAVGPACGARASAIARVGAPPTNGDWPPHLHFQIILDLLGPGRATSPAWPARVGARRLDEPSRPIPT